MEFNHAIDLTNRIISVVVSGTSILGCAFIIVSLYFTKFPRYSHLYYVFWLAVSDGLTAIVILVDHAVDLHTHATVCTIIGASFYALAISSFLWTSFIALFHFEVLQPRFVLLYHSVCWGYPIATAIYLALAGRFVPSPLNTFPHLSSDINVLFFGTLAFAFLVNVCAYIQITYQRRKRNSEVVTLLDTTEPVGRVAGEAASTTIKLARYCLVFLICWIPTILFFIVLRTGNNSSNVAIVMVSVGCMAFFNPMQGLANALVYGLHKESMEFMNSKLKQQNKAPILS